MPGVQSATAAVVDRLIAAGCVAAVEEAGELTAAAPDEPTLERWVRRREVGEPLAWIVGTVQFCGLTVQVDRGVYVPRAQSEELARRAGELLSVSCGAAVDLCTGTGAIAAHLQASVPTATVIGVDIDQRAARCARRNGVQVLLGDLDDPLRGKAFDVVCAVAPYVPTDAVQLLPADVQRYEPRRALDGGDDGLKLIRRIVRAAARLLCPGGWLVVELGSHQDEVLRPALAASGFEPSVSWFDEDGDLRGLVAQAGH